MKKHHLLYSILCLILCSLQITSCKQKEASFQITGEIKDASDTTLYLYKREIVGVTLIDSARTNADGSFRINTPAPQYPELYVLRMGQQMINLAVDSLDTIYITAEKNNFAGTYHLSGSPQSTAIQQLRQEQHSIEQAIGQLKKQYANKQISDTALESQVRYLTDSLKKSSQNVILNNLRGIASYYALFQQVDGNYLFDPMDRADSKLFSAVATAWDTYHKESPRAKHLKSFTLQALNQRRMIEQQAPLLEQKIQESNNNQHFHIDLPGVNNQNIALNSLKGKIVLLDFTMYQATEAAVHNIELNKIYQKYANKGFEIYQVSFETPTQLWRTSAENLPWICVREDNPRSDLLIRFNIQSLPTSFLLDRNGDIQHRITSIDQLTKELNKLLQQ